MLGKYFKDFNLIFRIFIKSPHLGNSLKQFVFNYFKSYPSQKFPLMGAGYLDYLENI